MDKKYQVFVSSTYEDLKEERGAVIWQLQSMGHIAVGMEAFPSSDSNAWKVITRQIDMSDYYVLILKNRYGSVDDDGQGWTEKEYDYAVESGLPVLAFRYSGELNSSLDYDRNNEAIAKLEAFKEKVDARHTRTTWKTKDELKANVAAAVATQTNLTPGVGWVRADQVTESSELLSQLNTLRLEKAEVEDEVTRLSGLLHEHGHDPGNKEYSQDDEFLEFTVRVGKDRSGTVLTETHKASWNTIFDLLAFDLLTGLSTERFFVLVRDRLTEWLQAQRETDFEVISHTVSNLVYVQFYAVNWVTTTASTLPILDTSPPREGGITFFPPVSRTQFSSIVQLSPKGREKYFSRAAIKSDENEEL